MRTTLLILAPLLLAAPAVSAKETILPGYWESRNNATFIIKTPEKVERRCIKPEQVDAYLSGPSTSHYKCDYASKTVVDGAVHFRGQCKDKHGRAFEVEINGAYAPEHFTMGAKFKPAGVPIYGTATTDAHRLSAECPAK